MLNIEVVTLLQQVQKKAKVWESDLHTFIKSLGDSEQELRHMIDVSSYLKNLQGTYLSLPNTVTVLVNGTAVENLDRNDQDEQHSFCLLSVIFCVYVMRCLHTKHRMCHMFQFLSDIFLRMHQVCLMNARRDAGYEVTDCCLNYTYNLYKLFDTCEYTVRCLEASCVYNACMRKNTHSLDGLFCTQCSAKTLCSVCEQCNDKTIYAFAPLLTTKEIAATNLKDIFRHVHAASTLILCEHLHCFRMRTEFFLSLCKNLMHENTVHGIEDVRKQNLRAIKYAVEMCLCLRNADVPNEEMLYDMFENIRSELPLHDKCKNYLENEQFVALLLKQIEIETNGSNKSSTYENSIVDMDADVDPADADMDANEDADMDPADADVDPSDADMDANEDATALGLPSSFGGFPSIQGRDIVLRDVSVSST